MTTRIHSREKAQRGVTVIVTVVLLLLMSILVLSSITHSGDESSAGARARATARVLHAADGGLQMGISHIVREPPNTAAIDTNIAGIGIQSRTRAQTTAQTLNSLGPGPPPEGYGLNAGSGYSSEIFGIDITSLSNAGSTAEVQGKVSRFTGAPGGY